MASGAAAQYLKELLVVHGTSTQELQLTLLVASLLLLLLLLVSMATRLNNKKKQQMQERRRQVQVLPPSPPGKLMKLPVIGHLHLMLPLPLVSSQQQLPHAALRDLDAKHGRDGLLLLRLGAVPTLVVSSPSAAEAVMRTQDHALASRPWSAVADILFYGATSVGFAPYGDRWRRSRKAVATHVLSTKKVHASRHGRLEEVRFVVAKIRREAAAAAPAAVDMSELLGAYAHDAVCRAVLGESHRADGCNVLLMELVQMNVSLLGGFNLEDYFPRLAAVELFRRLNCAQARKVHERWDQLLDKLIQQRQESSSTASDLIDVLLALEQEEEYGLTRDNIKALLMETFQAGIEPAYLVLEYTMAELMMNRPAMSRLQTEVRNTPLLLAGNKQQDRMVMEEDLSNMPYLKAVVKETLRLHPPAPLLIPRLSTTDYDINGYSIPSGTRVFVNAWALAREPASWDRADDFMPERFLQQGPSDNSQAAAAPPPDMRGAHFQFVPFGAGRRICPGINSGMATIEIMLANLVYHFDWKLQNEQEAGSGRGIVDMTEVFGLALRRKEKLFLVPTIP